MTDPFDPAGATGSPLTVTEQIEEAGGPAAAARLVALAVGAEEIGFQVWASLPIPAARTYELFLARYEWVDNDIGLYGPELRLSIGSSDLTVVAKERWGPPSPPENPQLRRLSPEAASLDPDRRAALEEELEVLCERVAALFIAGTPLSPADAAAVRRFDLLLRFLTSEELLSSYARLSPGFSSWVDRATGTGPLHHVAEAPEPSPAPADQREGVLAAVAGAWRVGPGALLDAATELGVTIEPASPLAREVSATGSAGPTLSDLVPGWPTPEWRAVLEALCRPRWSVERVMGEPNLTATRTCYIGEGRAGVAWVDHLVVDGQHVLSAPFGPEDVVEEVAGGGGPHGAEPASSFTVSAAEVETALPLADLWMEYGEDAFSASPPARAVSGPATFLWSTLVPCLAVDPLDSDDPGPIPIEESAAVRNLARSLGTLRRFVRVRVSALRPDGTSMSRGLLVAHADPRSWVIAPTGPWPGAGLPGGAEIEILSVSEDQVRDVVSELLGGTGDEAGPQR